MMREKYKDGGINQEIEEKFRKFQMEERGRF